MNLRALLHNYPLLVKVNGALLGAAAVALLQYAAHIGEGGEFILPALALTLVSFVGLLVNGGSALYAAVIGRRFAKAGIYLVAALVWAVPLWQLCHMRIAIGGEYKPKHLHTIQH